MELERWGGCLFYASPWNIVHVLCAFGVLLVPRANERRAYSPPPPPLSTIHRRPTNLLMITSHRIPRRKRNATFHHPQQDARVPQDAGAARRVRGDGRDGSLDGEEEGV